MSTNTLLYIIIAGIIALLLALFQYWKKTNKLSKLNASLAFFRFITYFSVLLLLINPKFEKETFYIEKPNLVIAVDNSSSIKYLEQDNKSKEFINEIKLNAELNNHFNVEYYALGNTLKHSDSISFNEQQTNINKAFNELSQIYKNSISPTILISDGNQTYGNDYEFTTYKQPIYPIILGDTVSYTDLKIQQLNVNKYAYLKNKFPVEVIVVYNGDKPVNSRFVVNSGNATIFSKNISFSKNENSKLINFTLPAAKVGVQTYRARILPINSEKNVINNSKNFAVDVIDQQTKIALVSDIIHPDLGTIKKSIESNEQRSVAFFKPNDLINQINDFQLVILYQPTNTFKELIKLLNTQNTNRLVISGSQTNWQFLNSVTDNYKNEITTETENYQAELNSNFSTFIVDDLDFESFPPLLSAFGTPEFSIPNDVILFKKVRNLTTEKPLLTTFEINSRREAILFGEGIWKWRAQSFLNTKSFNEFDNFIGKLVQYLASKERKSRLNVEYESFYEGNSNIIIKAQFFNKNYEFDANESLQIILKDKSSQEIKTIPLLLKDKNYEVDLSSLPAANYSFTVKTANENISKSGNFTILDYNVEQQFLNADVTKLQQLATNSSGIAYFVENTNSLFNDLITNTNYKPIQKSTKNTVPLIDWKYLLALIALSLAIEWFTRKYNGLI